MPVHRNRPPLIDAHLSNQPALSLREAAEIAHPGASLLVLRQIEHAMAPEWMTVCGHVSERLAFLARYAGRPFPG